MTTGAMGPGSGAAGLTLGRSNALGIATFNRPERRNAITRDMEVDLAGWYPRLAKDPGIYAASLVSELDRVFSVGGDVRDILELARHDIGAARAALGFELRLCWLHECFSKPTISLIDGVVMGTGVGLTLYGTHRVAGDGYRFSMPETAIGYFPDCGVSHAFARMAKGIGLYLGLTGAEVGPADALALGLATHTIPREAYAAVSAQIADADPVDPVLDVRHRDLGDGPLTTHAARIARYFDAPSLIDILERLEKPHVEDREWASETAAVMRSRSPLALALTFRSIVDAAGLDIRETLIQDFRLAWRLVGDADFHEGVRAALIDKDRQPRWRHRRVEDVPPDLVSDYFAPLGQDELALPTRREMDAARS